MGKPVQINTEILKTIISIFKNDVCSKSKALTTDKFLESYNIGINSRSLRFYLGYIRKHDLCGKGFILSNTANGYWYTENREELSYFIAQENRRIRHQQENFRSLKSRLKNVSDRFTQQLSFIS